MKPPTTLVLVIFFSSSLVAQAVYTRLPKEVRRMFDDIPFNKGEETTYYQYAVKLFNQDSLQKAGKIFDRIYWLDTTAALAKESLLYRTAIETIVKDRIKLKLYNAWEWKWSGTNWGPSDLPAKSKKTKKIIITSNSIQFYTNDSLTRETKYILTQSFDWMMGFAANLVQYEDNKQEWYYNVGDLFDFVSDRIWIEQKSDTVCGRYGESYTRWEPSSVLPKNTYSPTDKLASIIRSGLVLTTK